MNGLFPPTNEVGILIEKLSDLPDKAYIKDYNEFFRLYYEYDGDTDKVKQKYVYRVKKPNSPLMSLLYDRS